MPFAVLRLRADYFGRLFHRSEDDSGVRISAGEIRGVLRGPQSEAFGPGCSRLRSDLQSFVEAATYSLLKGSTLMRGRFSSRGDTTFQMRGRLAYLSDIA